MTPGLQLLASVVDNASRDVFRALDGAYFIEDEQPAWNFISSFFDRYGALPDRQALWENGIQLPAVQGPIHYHRDMLRNREVFRTFQDQTPNIQDALVSSNMEQLGQALEAVLAQMRGMDGARDNYSLSEAARAAFDDFLLARAAPGLRGITYGWPELDEVTGGARDGELATIVARPGVGKSFTLARMACMAWSQGHSIGFVSMEMGAIETARRILAMGSGINADMIQRGTVSDWGEEILRAQLERMEGMPAFNMLVGDLSKSSRDVDFMIQEHEPDIIYVDASYLLKPAKAGSQMAKKFEQSAEVMREIKGLALSRDKPIVQTVQFNRSQKQDEDMSLDNIGQTDEVGQLSALVMGMKKGQAPYEDVRRNYRVLKNRHGPDGFDFETRFEHTPFNMDQIEEDEADYGNGLDDNGDWDGRQGPAPAMTEWSV